MRYFCPGCGTKYNKPEEEIPEEGASVACEKCGFNITLKPPRRRSSAKVPGSTSGPSPGKGKKKAKVDSTERVIRTPKAKPAADPGENDQEWPEDEPETVVAGAPTDPEVPAQPSDAEPEPETSPKPKPAKKKVKPKKPRGKIMGGYLASLGTGKSGPSFRFRDLFFALSTALDYRKLLVVGLMVFVGSLLFAGLGWLGTLTKSNVGMIIGLVLGGVIFWALVMLGMGAVSFLTDREMEAGKRLPVSEGIRFASSRPFLVLGTPFVYVVGIIGCGAVIAVLSLIGRIPYAGPLIYGLTFLATFGLAFVAVLLALMFLLTSFSYVPAVTREALGPMAGARRMIAIMRNNPGWYMLHVLLAAVCTFLLIALLNFLVSFAFSYLGWIGGKAMGADLASVFLSVPFALFGILVVVIPDPLLLMFQAASGSGWQFTTAGWMVGLALLAVFSLVLAFGMVYFASAGVVNYHLLKNRESDSTGK